MIQDIPVPAEPPSTSIVYSTGNVVIVGITNEHKSELATLSYEGCERNE
jgi:hypothetical protein